MNLLVRWTVFCCLLLSSSHVFALVNNSFTQPYIKTNKQTLNLTAKQVNKKTSKDTNEKLLANSNTIALIQFKQIRGIYDFSGEALYRYGRFRAKSSITQNKNNDIAYYLQSSYLVFNGLNIEVSVEAKIKNINNDNIKDNSLINVNLNSINNAPQLPVTTNSLAVTGSYKLNKNWHVTGSLGSTTLNEQSFNKSLSDSNREEVAIIGTSYSF